MKILQIAPVFQRLEKTNKAKYGAIEKVLINLHDGFNNIKGHDSYVIASANSNVDNLIPSIDTHLWGLPADRSSEFINLQKQHFEKVMEEILQGDYSIIHDHSSRLIFSKAFEIKKNELKGIPIVITPHYFQMRGGEDMSDISINLSEKFGKIESMIKDGLNLWFVLLSKSQKELFSDVIQEEKSKLIYNGIKLEEFPFQEQKQDYLFSIGSIEYDKGQDLAVKLALNSRTKLYIAGPIRENNFFENEIAPYESNGGLVEYVGELDHKKKVIFFKTALATILPIRIQDGHSLVRLESQACGTPIITLNKGSAIESMIDGKTGYLCEGLEDMVYGLKCIKRGNINPQDCRRFIKENFSLDKQVKEHLGFYEKVLSLNKVHI